jgi:RHS repeat-associated protein
LKNNYQYQGDFSEMDEDIGWNDFELRNYDAQTGRWVQQDPFGQFTSPYTGMGNDPTDLIDPSGGIGIPCPGTSQLAIFFAKAGETVGKMASWISGVNSLVKVGVDVAKVGDEIYNNSVEVKIINRQLVANMTLQAGEDLPIKNLINIENTDPIPPIFWEEYWYPSVEAADYSYSNTFYANAEGQVITIASYPNVKFLLFHYESNTQEQYKNGNAARYTNRDLILNTNVDDRHEVPYKSTKEGGSRALMYPVERSQNQRHGNDLRNFYQRYKLKDGDPFLVPLYEPTLQPSPVRNFKRSYKPNIKIYDGSPFEWFLPSPIGKGALIEKLLKGIFAY